MNLKNVILAALLLLMGGSAIGQDTALAKKPEDLKIKSYAEIVTPDAISSNGLFGVHKVGEKYYFEIPDTLLGKELLSTTRLSKVPAGSPKYGGEIVNSKTIAFESGIEKNTLLLKVITLVAIADSSDVIARAVRNATVDPIAMVFPIKARGKENKSSIIDVTDLFQRDNIITGFSADSKSKMRLGGAAADRSYIERIKDYPINIETKTIKTFSVSFGASESNSAAGAGVGVTMELSNSIMLMPQKPMQARYFDPRVGYFSDNYKVFSDDQQKVGEKNFIVRYRLEPKPEDLEKYKRGELVEPQKPIIYYVDPATPKQWRSYIIAAVNDWNVAFEQAGFKNAIIGKVWPDNDTTMDIEDARYNVVRFFPSEVENAYGSNVNDPRSGEILQSYVGVYYNLMKKLHDWYFVQAAAIDPKARTMKFSDDLMGQLIRGAVSHEIGHTLGLLHNMGASSETPVEKLRDKKWVEANGHTVSIMDYARYNYAAQPQDSVSEKGIMQRIGIYDKWAIQWGYRYTGVNEEEDKKLEAKLILDSLKADPRLWFGGSSSNLADPIDPRVQTEDLGDNSMKASEYGIKNLKVVMNHLLKWTREDNDTYDNAADMYDELCGQYQSYFDNVLANIGGAYGNIKSVEQPGDVYSLVPKQRQRDAIAFLNKEVFETPSWLFDKSTLNKFRKPVRAELPQKLQDIALTSLLSTSRLYRMEMQRMRFGSEAYSVKEMLSDLNKDLWRELNTHTPIDSYRRFLQKREIEFSALLLAIADKPVAKGGIDFANTDIPVALISALKNIRKKSLAAIPFYKDDLSRAHLRYVVDKIDHILNTNIND